MRRLVAAVTSTDLLLGAVVCRRAEDHARLSAVGRSPGGYIVRVMGYGLRAPKSAVRGSDVAGRVEQVGANVTRFRPGDHVLGTCTGSFAEYATLRRTASRLHLPGGTRSTGAVRVTLRGGPGRPCHTRLRG